MKSVANHFAAALFVGIVWTASVAQVPDPLPDAPAWELGPVRVFPIARFESRHIDNLFSRPDDAGPVSTTVGAVDAGFLARLPFSRSRASLGYLFGWRDFGQPGLTAESNHQARLDTELVLPRGLTLAIEDRYENGVLDTQNVDPAGEIPFVAQRYVRNAPSISLTHERPGHRRLRLAGWGNDIRFADPRAAGYFDQNAAGIRAYGWHAFTPTTAAAVTLDVSRDDLDRPAGQGFDADARSERRTAARLAAQVRPGPGLAIEVQSGWASYRYRASKPSSFDDWIASFVLDRNDPAGSHIALSAGRDAYPAAFGDANFLVSRQVRLAAANNDRARVGAGGSVSYYVNAYPTSTTPRRDRSRVLEAWAGWRPRPGIQWRLDVRRERRSSTYPGVAFERNEWGVSMRWGG